MQETVQEEMKEHGRESPSTSVQTSKRSLGWEKCILSVLPSFSLLSCHSSLLFGLCMLFYILPFIYFSHCLPFSFLFIQCKVLCLWDLDYLSSSSSQINGVSHECGNLTVHNSYSLCVIKDQINNYVLLRIRLIITSLSDAHHDH